MLPIVLNQDSIRVGLAGDGDAFQRRLSLVADSGVKDPVIFGARAPTSKEIGGLHVLFVAGLRDTEARALSATARALGVLVNVEDKPELCDFHVPALVRRGDLLLTVSTGGRSPGVARILRETLEKQFGPEWAARLDEIAGARAEWRASGLAPSDISERTNALVDARGWRA